MYKGDSPPCQCQFFDIHLVCSFCHEKKSKFVPKRLIEMKWMLPAVVKCVIIAWRRQSSVVVIGECGLICGRISVSHYNTRNIRTSPVCAAARSSLLTLDTAPHPVFPQAREIGIKRHRQATGTPPPYSPRHSSLPSLSPPVVVEPSPASP